MSKKIQTKPSTLDLVIKQEQPVEMIFNTVVNLCLSYFFETIKNLFEDDQPQSRRSQPRKITTVRRNTKTTITISQMKDLKRHYTSKELSRLVSRRSSSSSKSAQPKRIRANSYPPCSQSSSEKARRSSHASWRRRSMPAFVCSLPTLKEEIESETLN